MNAVKHQAKTLGGRGLCIEAKEDWLLHIVCDLFS